MSREGRQEGFARQRAMTGEVRAEDAARHRRQAEAAAKSLNATGPPAGGEARHRRRKRAPARANVRKRKGDERCASEADPDNTLVNFEPPLTSASTVSR